MSDANNASEAGAGAEALLGLAAQAGQAVRLPSLPSLASKQDTVHPSSFLPTPPPLSLPTQPQPLQPQPQPQPQPQSQPQPQPQPQSQSLLQSQPPPLPPPPSLGRERLPTLSEWAEPAFRSFPPPLLAPLPERWQASAPLPSPSQYPPYHNPWQQYPYQQQQYYYYSQQPQPPPPQPHMPYPMQHQPVVSPVPPPLALPNQPVVPPLRIPMHDPVRDATTANDPANLVAIPQPRPIPSRDPLLERLTSEAAAAPKHEAPSRARGLADLMNPTDTIPGTSDGIGQTRMEMPLVRPESVEKVVPVSVPSVPSVEPERSDASGVAKSSSKADLAAIADTVTEKSERAESTSKEEHEQVEKKGATSDESPNVPQEKPNDVKTTILEDMQKSEEKKRQTVKDQETSDAKDHASERKPEVIDDEDKDNDNDNDNNNNNGETGENADSEVTRCPCGSTANSGTMIACDQCNTWQHSRCMGFRRSSEVPEHYFCHICRPEEMRVTCIAHPKHKERSSKERDGRDGRRENEVLLAGVKPVELRKIFAADMRHKKALLRAKGESIQRYAGIFKSQFAKHRQSVIDGLVILLDMQRQDVTDRLEVAVKRLRGDKSEESERRRNSANSSNDGLRSEPGSARAQSSSRSGSQKRARPTPIALEALDTANGARSEAHDAPTDFDLGAEASNGRGMSREERKIQQTMKLFARMEEREREKKKPRTGEAGTSPKVGPPSRPKTPRSAQHRTSSPKGITASPESDHASGRVPVDVRRHEQPPLEPEHKQKQQQDPQPSKTEEKGEQPSQPKLEHPVPQQKSSLVTRSDGEQSREASRRDRDHRRERLERGPPKRKESSSPDAVSGTGNGRRKSLLARERSHESKRRRLGSLRDSDRRGASSKEPPKRDSSLDFTVSVPGPSVLGSKMIVPSRLSKEDQELREAEESRQEEHEDRAKSSPNRKERLLTIPRREAMKKKMNGGTKPSAVKKRFRPGDEAREAARAKLEEDVNRKNENELPSARGSEQPTLSVSMVVVSEKGSLPDKGQILESTRLILPGTKTKKEEALSGTEDKGRGMCLKKRAVMFAKQESLPDNDIDESKDLLLDSSVKESAPCPFPSKVAPPASPIMSNAPTSPLLRVASPKLRSSPVLPLRSPSLRSVPPADIGKIATGSSPLPSFKSQKKSSPAQRPRSQTPEDGKKAVVVNPEQPREDEKPSTPASAPAARYAVNESKSSDIVTPPKSGSSQPIDTEKPGTTETAASKSALTFRTSPDEKKPSVPTSAPALRSIRSMPLPTTRKSELTSDSLSRSGKDAEKDEATEGSPRSASRKESSSGATISDFFQQRLQGFLKPAAASPTPGSRGNPVKHGPSSPMTSPRANLSKPGSVSPAASIRGSAAKLGAALPLSSKPNLDSLRNSSGLSPRFGGVGSGYMRTGGPSFRSKPSDGDRPWNSLPSFSAVKRQNSSFNSGRGHPRGGHVPNGKPSSFSGTEKGRFTHGRDSGLAGREEDKSKNATPSPKPWGRSYTHRNGWSGNANHHHSGDGGGRGNRRGYHGN